MPAHPDHALWFISQLRHGRGRWAGQPFIPAEWQAEFVRELLKLKPDGHRQHTEALLGVARKNGKTTLLAAVALVLLVLDGERGGEVIGAAGKKDQAKLMLSEAKRMVRLSSIGGTPLSEFLTVQSDSIYFPELDAVYRVISADGEREHGLNPHAVLADELHTWPDYDLWDVLTTAQGARANPLFVSITTAGAKKSGVCWDEYCRGEKVASGARNEPGFLYRWYEAAPGLAIDSEEAWRQANPTYPETPSPSFLKGMAAKAKSNPLREYAFRRLHLNQWTNTLEKWLPQTDWDACGALPAIPEGAEVVIAVDAAIKRDTFAVWAVWVNPEDGSVHAQLRHFKADRDDGYIDLLEVKAYILGLNAMYRVKALAGDPAYMTLLAQELQERGMPWRPYAQSDEKMLVASEVLQRVVLDHRLRHGHNQVLEEHLASTAVRVGDRGVRISKGKSGGHNDSVVGLAMGLAVALEGEQETEHFFEVLG